MLLIKRIRRVTTAAANEDGAVLAASVGYMAVALLLVSMIVTSVMSGTSASTSTRAGVQSEAAAQAGIAAARVIVEKSACAGASTITNPSGIGQKYSVAVSWRKGTSGSWTDGCPASKRYQVKLVSTGTAAAKAVGAQTANDVSRIEAIYGATLVSTTVTGTGAAIYSYGTAGGTGLGSTGIGLINTLAVGGPKATVQVLHGDVTCTGVNANMSADIVVADGSFTQNLLCLTINGNVTASGNVELDGLLSNVTGDVSAGSLRVGATSTITGNAWVRGTASGGNGLTRTISERLTAKAKSAGISARYTDIVPTGPGASPYVTAAVPNWVDYDFTGAAGWPGFTIKTLAATDCSTTGVRNAITAIGTAKGVIDAQACTNGTFLTSLNIGSQANDLAFILPNSLNVEIGGVQVTAGSHNLWFIQPDSDVTDGVPTCPAGGKLSMNGINVAFPHMLIYTPCTYQEGSGLLSALTFTGQIYAGKASLGASLISARVQNYTQVGIPGVDLTAGTTTTAGPRLLISMRNVATG